MTSVGTDGRKLAPGALGAAPTIQTSGYYVIDNRVTTVVGKAEAIEADRMPNSRVLRLTGTVGAEVAPLTLRYGINDRFFIDASIPFLYRTSNFRSGGAGGAARLSGCCPTLCGVLPNTHKANPAVSVMVARVITRAAMAKPNRSEGSPR